MFVLVCLCVCRCVRDLALIWVMRAGGLGGMEVTAAVER